MRFERWLAVDPRHREALDWCGGPWAALDRPVRAGVADDVLRQLQVFDRRRRRRLVASATVAVFVVGAAFWQSSPWTSHPDPNPAVTARLVLPAHQVFPDGTTVDLKDGAQIAVNYTPSARRVTLGQGEAHFQVAHDPTKPFIVTASGVEFRAVGTAFSVQLGAKQIELLVAEGSVAVEQSQAAVVAPNGPLHESGATLQTIAMVNAGNRLVVPVQGENDGIPAPAPVSAADISDHLAWRAPRLEFTGTPLAEAVKLLNQQLTRRNVRLVIEDPSIGQVKVSGLFRADNTAALIDLLESGFAIKAERRGDSEITLRRTSTEQKH